MHIEGSLGAGLRGASRRNVTSWVASISALSLIATTVLTPWTEARAAGPLGPSGPVISPAPKASPVAPTPVIPQAPVVVPQLQAPAPLGTTTFGTPTSSTGGDAKAPTDKGNPRLPLPGIRVSAKRTGGGATRNATTDSDGNVTFDKLMPGTYTFQVDPKSLASGAPVGNGPQETFIELLVVIFIIATVTTVPDSSPTQSFVSETARGQAVTFTATVARPSGTGSVTLRLASGSGPSRASNFLPGNTMPATGAEFGIKSASGTVLPIKTDEAGNFTLGKLAPGKYTLDLGKLAKDHATGNQAAPKLLVGLLLPAVQAVGTASCGPCTPAKNFSFISTWTTNALVLTVLPDGSVGSIDGGDGHPWKNADGAIVAFTDGHASRLGTGDTASGINGTLVWAK